MGLQSVNAYSSTAYFAAQKASDGLTQDNFAALLADSDTSPSGSNPSPSVSTPVAAQSAPATSPSSSDNSDDMAPAVPSPTPAQQFMSYMNESESEKMEDAWLGAHGMTRQQFDALPEKEKEKIRAEMKADMQVQIQQSTDKQLAKSSAGGT